MPIQLSCPKCGKQYTLKDEMRGRTARCKPCRATFQIAEPEVAEAEPEPAVESSVEPRDKAKRTGKSNRKLLIGGAVATVVLLFSCCGGVSLGAYFLVGRAKRAGNEFTAQVAKADQHIKADLEKAKSSPATTPDAPANESAPKSSGSGELDGTYSIVSLEMLGQKLSKAQIAKIYTDYVIRGDTMSYTMRGQAVKGTIKIDPAAQPATLDFIADSTTTYCIYRLEGDTLTLCMGGLNAATRPKEFKMSKDVMAIMVLKRK